MFITLINILHILTIMFQYIGPFIFNDKKILAIIIIINMLMLTQWYAFKTNIFIQLEKTNYKFSNDYDQSFIANKIQNTFGINDMIIFYFMIILPGFNIWYSLDKIIYNCKK